MFPAAALPAVCVCAAALMLWLGRQWLGTGPLAFVGWVEILIVLVTTAAIVWTAAVPEPNAADPEQRAPRAAKRATLPAGGGGEISSGQTILLGCALLGDAAGALLAVVGVGWAQVGWKEVGALFALVLSWSALWCAVAWGLRRWGPGISAGVPLALSMVLMAAPVVMMPAVHAAAHWGPGVSDGAGGAGRGQDWQGRAVKGVAISSPLLAGLDALRPAVRVDWATLPGMYDLSGLGQEVPMELPRWWINSLVYGGAALLVGIGRLLLQARAPADR